VKSNLTLYLVSDATLFTTQIKRQTCDLHGVGFVGKPLQIGTTCAALPTLRHYLCSINYAKALPVQH